MEEIKDNIQDNSEEIFKDYSNTSTTKDYSYKKLIITIVSVVLVLFIAGGSFIAGYFSGSAESIDKDMPLLVDCYELLKKYYYEDISWDEFQAIAAQAMMNSVDNFTYMYETDYSTGSLAMGVNIVTNTYHNHTISFITPNSAASKSVAARKYDDATLASYTILENEIKLAPGDRIFAVGQLGKTPTIVHGADSKVMTSILDIIKNSEDPSVELYVYKSNQSGGFLPGIYVFPMTLLYLPSTSAFYYSSEDIYDETNTTAMIRLTQFNGTAISDFSNCIDKFIEEGKTNLILDLRGNGGGDSEILGYISACLLKGASDEDINIAYYKYNAGDYKYRDTFFTSIKTVMEGDEEYTAKNLPSLIENFKVTILCDSGSASCSEVLIGALEFYNGAKIIGSTTYGKGVAQTVRYMQGGKYTLLITNGKYYIPTHGDNGETLWEVSIHGVGFTPDIENYISPVYKDMAHDPYISRALTLLTK